MKKNSLSIISEKDGQLEEKKTTTTNVHRKLKQRHLSMIAIGGTIGTGLFLGTAQALHTGGPVGLFLGYAVMGAAVYTTQVALGEMVTLLPVSGSICHYSSRFVDPALGFAVGVNWWYSAFIGLATEITAAAIVVQYWDTSTPIAIYITIFWVTICGINFLGVKWYGEAEFLFAFLKVSTIVGLIVLGIVLDLGGGPDHDRLGFRYWINPGPFAQLDNIPGPTGRFLAFWDMFIQASYAYSGTEVVALSAAEAENPRKTVPKAVKRVFYRILLFYLGGVLVIGLLVSSDDPMLSSAKGKGTGAASPFVIAVKRAGITVLPDIINAIILTSAYSSGNCALYSGSRILYGLACEGMAPGVFLRCTRAGLPLWALVATSTGGLLAFLRLNVNASLVFRWLSNISSVTGLCTWFTILFCYIRFYRGMRFQGVDRHTLPYRAPLQPYLSYFGITMISLVIIFNGFTVFIAGHWSSPGFVAAYITVPIYVLSFLYWKMIRKTKWIKNEKMDLVTGLDELELIDNHYRHIEFIPKTLIEKFWDWLM